MTDTIMRLPDWQPRLTAYLEGLRGQPFRWGRLDCAIFVAGAVEAMTGADFARGWRGYRTEAAGLRALADKGFADHAALVASILPECHPSQARPGDVVLMADNALGILQGRMIYAVGLDGFGVVPADHAVRAWHV